VGHGIAAPESTRPLPGEPGGPGGPGGPAAVDPRDLPAKPSCIGLDNQRCIEFAAELLIDIADRGEHALRGMDGSFHLFAIAAAPSNPEDVAG
jgi:hypothetical protein